VLWGASDNFDHAVQWVSIYRRVSQPRVRFGVLPDRHAACGRKDFINKLCGEDAMNLDLLKSELIRDEGFREMPYRCTAGKLTTGVGRNLDDNPLTPEEIKVVGYDGRSEKITLEAATYLLESDIRRTCEALDRALPWWKTLDEVRRRVLVNMAFNLGISRLLGFHTTLGWIKQGNYTAAAGEMLLSLWARQVKGRATRLAQMMRTGVASGG
jgi:lysozyme